MSTGAACIITVAFITVCFLLRRTYTPLHSDTRQIITINKLLHKLRRECIEGQIDVAQNTVEDIKQEWEYLDVILRGRSNSSSDSLQTLDSLVRLMLIEDNPKHLLPIVVLEINSVNERLDSIK